MKIALLFLLSATLNGSSIEKRSNPVVEKEDSINLEESNAGDGKIIIEGVYKGKNLYVQNPILDTEKEYGFCITSRPIVNGHKSTRLVKSSAFEIDLSYLKEGDKVIIEINHRLGCSPKILNLEAIDGVVK